MSWSAEFRLEAGQTEPSEEVKVTNIDGVPEHLEQYREAIASAFGVLVSGVVGDPRTHAYVVRMSGHGNPDHEPAEGWANDFVSIVISQVDPS